MAETHRSAQQSPHRQALVVRVAQQAALTPIAGGWIADTGRHSPARQILLLAAAALRSGAGRSVIWVIQAESLAHELANPGQLCAWLQHFEQVRHLGAVGCRRVAVVPQTGPQARALAYLIKSLGLCVYDGAPDGSVYAEIGPVRSAMPGIAGPVIDGAAALTLRRIADQRATTHLSSAERQDLTLIELLFVQTVLQMCCPTGEADRVAEPDTAEPPLLERAVGARPTPPSGGEAYYRHAA